MSGRLILAVFLLDLFLVLRFPTNSFSAESKGQTPLDRPRLTDTVMSYEKEEEQIPKSPTAPPPLTQRIPVDVPHCERHFVFKGKRLECDSEVGKDALRLSLLMQDLPSAEAELNSYRENRQKIRIAGFAGTVGVLAMIAGVVVSHPLLEVRSGSIRPGGFITLAGIAVAANSLIYGLSMLKANEIHVDNAVQQYNAVHSDLPIELEFSTHIDF